MTPQAVGATVAAVRPHARVLMVSGDEHDVVDLLSRAAGVKELRRCAKKVQLTDLAAMKKQGRKIVGVVAWDYQMARIVDRAGVDLVSVGDTVGINLWGQPNPLEVTMDQMIVVVPGGAAAASAARCSAATSPSARCRRARRARCGRRSGWSRRPASTW